eukprot:CAMPEP_0179077116 /NCGR_PEP_ID=MMETSP0796-20121207/34449_1 /TAXON_ID=73915 /ORGANISM="Pyrodinium bahamense, Strain pbaha01" /LENGTH=130 /DNA_ID=CAMNT_0020774387 /DNA_START=27 /DNA_END=419 /DNA_ORIENTATION=+
MTAAMPRTGEALELGRQPVLLNNPHGWANVTRFATLTMAKLSDLERRVERSSATALGRALSKIEKRQLREGFLSLHQHCNLDSFVHARGHAEDMLQRLHSLVDTFDIEVDHLVENIMQGTLEEDDLACSR